jgi:dye decolorizing peroxidase
VTPSDTPSLATDAVTSGPSRRRFLAAGAAAGAGVFAAGAAGVALDRRGAIPGSPPRTDEAGVNGQRVVPFYGEHQAGITARPGAFASFVALDLQQGVDRERLSAWMRLLTDDAARLTQGNAALADVEPELAATPAGLTVTVGFGPGFVDRARGAKPDWLAPLPAFGIDRLQDEWSGGDLLLIVASDEPGTVAHALRMLLKDSRSFATLRWRQDGFRRAYGSDPYGMTMRNLFGQVDGTANPRPGTADFDAAVWARPDAPAWLRGGTSFVLRRVALELDKWDAVDRVGRENTIGRRLADGSPLTGTREHDPLDLEAVDANGLPVISSVAHARRAHVTDPAKRIVRLGYNYEERAVPGVAALSQTGLLFGALQANVTEQYVPIQRALAEADLLNVWTTPIGSAVFAMPPGCAKGEYLGQALLEG